MGERLAGDLDLFIVSDEARRKRQLEREMASDKAAKRLFVVMPWMAEVKKYVENGRVNNDLGLIEDDENEDDKDGD